MVPTELNACAKVSRLCAVDGLPRMEISGLATTCTTVIPAASTNRAVRNMANCAEADAGTNSRHPAIISTSPRAAVRMYPTRRTTAAAGIDTSR